MRLDLTCPSPSSLFASRGLTLTQPRPDALRPRFLSLSALPPKLPSFDVLGRLVRAAPPVGRLVRSEAHGSFIARVVDALERFEGLEGWSDDAADHGAHAAPSCAPTFTVPESLRIRRRWPDPPRAIDLGLLT
jgi:hypothetical protein